MAVVGAGIVGCACAWELARRGLRVCLIDRGEVSGGTTGLGEGNVLCSDKEPGAELAFARAGLGLYDEVEELSGTRRASAARARSWCTRIRRAGRPSPSGSRASGPRVSNAR